MRTLTVTAAMVGATVGSAAGTLIGTTAAQPHRTAAMAVQPAPTQVAALGLGGVRGGVRGGVNLAATAQWATVIPPLATDFAPEWSGNRRQPSAPHPQANAQFYVLLFLTVWFGASLPLLLQRLWLMQSRWAETPRWPEYQAPTARTRQRSRFTRPRHRGQTVWRPAASRTAVEVPAPRRPTVPTDRRTLVLQPVW